MIPAPPSTHVDASVGRRIEHARQFLRRFDPEAEFITFQTFDDSPKRRKALARIVHADPAGDALATLAKLNAQETAGVFFAVNATDGKGRQERNIVGVRAVFVDLDGAPLAPVLAAGLDPHIVVESSPGKWHAYWLTDDCARDQFPRVQKALARRFGGDPSVHDLPRVLRVPGFLHRKGDPFASHVVEGVGYDGPPRALAEIVGTLKLDLNASDDRPAPTGAAGKIQPGHRHSHLFALGRSMARRSTPDAARAALTAENQTRCDPPLSDADVIYLADRAFEAKHAKGWSEPTPRDVGYEGPPSIPGADAVAAQGGRQPSPRDASVEGPASIPGADADAATSLQARLVPLVDLDAADPALFFVESILPAGEVTLLGGHGGLGKSYIALLLALHIVTRPTFGNLAIRESTVLFYSAEDGAATLRYRVRRLCAAHAIDPATLDGKLHLLDMSDDDAALHRECVRYTAGEKRVSLTTATLDDLAELVRELNPGVVIVDGASDTYDDNEVDRARVRAFVRSLRQRIARPGRAVLLLAHVNKITAKAGSAADGEAYSGSTAWHNSVRSRLALTGEADGVLTLQHQKANLGSKADPIQIEFRSGVPCLVGQGAHPAADVIAGRERERDEQDKVRLLAMIRRFEQLGERVPASATGPCTAHRLLRDEIGFPENTDSSRLMRLLRELQGSARLFRATVRTVDRKYREVFSTVPGGQESAPMPSAAPSAAPSGDRFGDQKEAT